MYKFFLIVDLALGSIAWRLSSRTSCPLKRTLYVILAALCLAFTVFNLIIWIIS